MSENRKFLGQKKTSLTRRKRGKNVKKQSEIKLKNQICP